ncbi:hypothetical protein B296_00007303 [Ensete ventricosum]|uniref:Uncharacterized protein n=1 Tax=Ensete ventricosum TaxID=4639 RepID=A0A427B7K0_ENSVE|nr:hypothetical protein B296_00007303 [Ensete ventricosum]
MGVVCHRGRISSASTNESHGRDLIIQRYDRSSWRVGLLQCSYSLKGAQQVRGQGRFVIPSTKGNCSENTGVLKLVVERGEEATMSPDGLSYPSAKRRSEREWTQRSVTVPQRRIYRSRKKGRICKATNSRVMGLAAPWYHRGGSFVESSIPYSYGGRTLVVKRVEEVENAEANSKYHDKGEGQRPRNFIRPVSRGFSSR